jgi:cell division protein FtsW
MKHFDRLFLILVVSLVAMGFFVFSSASLGLLSREGARFSSVAANQIILGIIGGGAALYITSHIHYRLWRSYAPYVFLLGIFLTLLVFSPLGMEHGGAKRWVDLGFVSFQPAEFLKYAFVVFLSAWLAGSHKKIHEYMHGLFPFIGIVGFTGALLLAQPDTDTFGIMALTALAMYIVSGGTWRDTLITVLGGVMALAILITMRPYLLERMTTFIDPSNDPTGASWQVRQSLIALGSGGLFGRGFGQSIQKFEYLPEPTNDSIFAVLGEEFGFIGTVVCVLLFTLLAMRGYRIAARSPDLFGTLVVIGITTVIVLQAFLNIAAMLALAPLSGLPLPFISHGGTALFAVLGAVGVVLNVSRYAHARPLRNTST